MADPRVKQLAYDALALSLTGPIDLFPRGTPTQSILGESAVSRNLNRSPILQNFDDGRASMTAYEPTMRERLAAGAQTGLEFLGMRRPQARTVSQGIFGGESSPIPANLGIADVVPFLGTALQTEEAVDSLGRARQLAGQGQYGQAAVETGMGILGLVPGAQATNRAADVVANRSVQAIMGDPNATARGVLEMAGDMAPLARMFKPEQVKSVLPETKIVDESGNPKLMYHGTREDFEQFDPGTRGAVFASPDPKFTNVYAGEDMDRYLSGGNVRPVYVDAKNPFDYDNPDHVQAVVQYIKKNDPDFADIADGVGEKVRTGVYSQIERPLVQNAIRQLGFDGFFVQERGIKNIAVFDPRQIKSATSDPAFTDLLE